ncbi:unnamed protein product [Echinostoma caproni]|uniref:CUB domain-containing protein n=1 Tax=Echinostoma caproni TaxID=27848 RepID=A0A183A811_9TREM|nr:unnamed protein product [Echinostoma caproni]
MSGEQQDCDESITVPDDPVDASRSIKAEAAKPKTCNLQFTTDEGYRLKLNVTDVTGLTSTDTKCTDNNLKFADDKTGLATATPYCDKTGKTEFDSTGNNMALQYYVSKIDAPAGYKASVKRVFAQASCGTYPESFDGTEQIFQFPVDGKPMELDVECNYKIVNTKGSKINVKIMHMKLDGAKPCSDDYVALSSNANPSSASEYVQCGSAVPSDDFNTTGSELYWKVKVKNYKIQPYLSMIIKSEAGFRNANVLVIFMYAAMNILLTV